MTKVACLRDNFSESRNSTQPPIASLSLVWIPVESANLTRRVLYHPGGRTLRRIQRVWILDYKGMEYAANRAKTGL